ATAPTWPHADAAASCSTNSVDAISSSTSATESPHSTNSSPARSGPTILPNVPPPDMTDRRYHIAFGPSDLPDGTTIALLSGDPDRSALIANDHLDHGRELARNRGLDSFIAELPDGALVICATSGMGAPSTSIVVNELVQVGVRTIIRIGTSGSIQRHVTTGSVAIASGAVTNQGAA